MWIAWGAETRVEGKEGKERGEKREKEGRKEGKGNNLNLDKK